MNTYTEIEQLKAEFVLPEIDKNLPEKEHDCTTDVNEYLNFAKRIPKFLSSEIILDYEIVSNAKAYSLSPIFLYDGVTRTPEDLTFASIEEMKEALKSKKYILYYTTVTPILKNIDTTEFKWVRDIKNCVVDGFSWRFRGVILN
jgi:hypothetical protein